MSARQVASRKMEISYCLQYLKPMRDKVAELLDAEKERISSITQNQIQADGVAELNDHIALRKALERFGMLEQELKEELHGDGPSEDEPEA